jgi:RNA polymerase sigma-70 factor (ECF subfamily)
MGCRLSVSDDRADVERVRTGDVSAFEGIVRRWQGPLVNLAYRFCRDRGRAEELAQEAFLRAYRALDGWRAESAFSTWLFALAANLYVSELRRIPAKTLSIDDVAEPRDDRAADGGLELADRDRAVRRAVHTLPSKYREALILFYFHGMDVAAAAVVALVFLVVAVVTQPGSGTRLSQEGPLGSSVVAPIVEAAMNAGAHWIALALLLTLASVSLSTRLGSRGA